MSVNKKAFKAGFRQRWRPKTAD